MATRPGHLDRPNEDFVGAGPATVVLLDGAGIRGADAVCSHGVAWYSHTLGAAVLGRMAYDGTADLGAILADAIDQVAESHRDTCDIADPSSPQSTVAMVRVAPDHLDYLVLADAFVVLEPAAGGPRVVTDPREVDVRRECSRPLLGLTPGTPAYERNLPSVIEALRARRNQPGGYWVAKDDPGAAAHAVTGTVPLGSLIGVALLSNGAARAVDPYRLLEWPAVLELLCGRGPDELLRQVRDAEAEGPVTVALPGSPVSDDATAAYCFLRPDR